MKHNPTTDPATQAEPLVEAELFVEKFGGKEAAIRQIRNVKAKGKVGRPKGPAYRQIDSQLLSLVYSLCYEWLLRLRPGQPLPARRLLIKKILKLCWQDDGGVGRMGRQQGRWNYEVCERLGLARGGSARLGTAPDAIVKRLDGRRPPIKGVGCTFFRDFGFVGTPWDPLCSDGVNKCYEPTSDEWEKLHRARPELQLLPD
jgi:hypothetical protein